MNKIVSAVREKYPGAYDDLSDDQLTIALGRKFPDAYSDVTDFADQFKRLTNPSMTASAPAPGTMGDGQTQLAPSPFVRSVNVANPATGTAPNALTAGQTPTLPDLVSQASAERRARQVAENPITFDPGAAVRQEPPAPEAQIHIPRLKTGPEEAQGISEVAAGLGEWALNSPAEFFGAMAYMPIARALEVRYAPEIAKSFIEDVKAGYAGDRKATGRALGLLAAVASPMALSKARQAIAKGQAEIAINELRSDVVNRTAVRSLDPANGVQMPTQPVAAPEIPTANALPLLPTGDTATTTQAKAVKNRPVVPETPPEPNRDVTIIGEIRRANARTKEEIRRLFPQLTREQAAALRDQAFPPGQEVTPNAQGQKEGVQEVTPTTPGASQPKPPEAPKAETPERLSVADDLSEQGPTVDPQNVTGVRMRVNDNGDVVYQVQYQSEGRTHYGYSDNPKWEDHPNFNKGEDNAVQKRSGKTVSVENPPQTGAEVGARIPEPKESTVPPQPGEQSSQPAAEETVVRDVENKPAPTSPEQAAPTAPPQEASVSSAKSAGVTAPEEPLAAVQTTTVEPQTQIQASSGAPLGPPANPTGPITPGAPIMTPKSKREIITALAKGLKIPIRFGRLILRNAGGYFAPVQDLIASKRANDIPIVGHEVGHKLDHELKFSPVPALAAELDALGTPGPNSLSSWKKGKSRDYKLKEGVAEFVRYWLTDPATAQTKAPNMFRAFEEALNNNKDFGDVMRQAQHDIDVLQKAPLQAQLHAHISIGENPNKTRYTIAQLTRDMVDDLHFLRLAQDDAAYGTVGGLKTSEQVYTLARLLRGTYGMADTFIKRGVVDFGTRRVRLGTSFEDALAPVSRRLDDFTDYIVAKRAREMHAQGKPTGLTDAMINDVIGRFDSDPAFQKAFADIKAWQDSLLQYAVDSGFVTKEQAARMRELNQDYVPLHRVFEVGAGEPSGGEGSGVGRGLNVGKPGSLKSARGSLRDIVNPLETMIKNAYALITASEKGYIHRSLADMWNKPGMGKWVEKISVPLDKIRVELERVRKQLEDAGADLTNVPDDLLMTFAQPSRTAPYGENIIRIMRDGKPEFYRLNKDLFNTFHALDLEDSGKIFRAFGSIAQLLRSGVVLAPDFALANALRDTFSAAVLSKYNALPFEVTIRGLAAMVQNPQLVAEWAASGGKNAIEPAFFDRTNTQKFLRERIAKDLTPAERATIWVKSPLQALRWLTEKAEEATRIGEYQKALAANLKKGMAEGDARRAAAYESRDRQDFAKGGAITKIARQATPFWNAGLQANVKLAQMLRDPKTAPGVILKGLAFITLPKLLEQYINYDDQDYWDRPQWERDLFFLIPFGKDENGHTKFLRIPTPFELGVIFGTFPGRIIQHFRQGDRVATKSMLSTVAAATIPNPIPPPINLVIELGLTGKQGWDIFRGRPVIPDKLADAPPDLQVTEQTSLTARKVGKMLHVSPMKVDHVIKGLTGSIGSQLTHNVADNAIRLATGETPTAKGKVPGGRFITTPAGSQSDAVEKFYQNLSKINEEQFRLKNTGEGKDYAGLLKPFNRAAEQMADLRKQAKQAETDAERQRIQLAIADLALQMNEAARTVGLK